MDSATTRRLAFIRYIYTVGIAQSRQPEPMSAVCVLSFHDSIELFLQLSSEVLNVGSNQPGFLGYWDILSKKTSTPVSQKESMRRLNKSRVALKHHGTLPSRLDIEAFRASVSSFFAENTPLIFGVDLDSVSLVDLIVADGARNALRDAQTELDSGNLLECLDQCAVSFAKLVDDYEDRKSSQYGQSPFFFGRDMHSLDSFSMGIRGDIGRFVDQVKESIDAMQSAIRILSLGLDYRQFIKFDLYTPTVYHTLSGTGMMRHRGSSEVTQEECRFCIDFVIDSALQLQDNDYTLPQ